MADSETKRSRYKKKRYVIPIVLIALLIAFRIYLPTLVKNYVNKVLADIPGYYGQVADIDISLYRGAYAIDGLYLNKVNADTQVPFLNFPKTDISVEWKSIFKGKIVSEIEMLSPEIIYVFEDQQTNNSEGDADVDDWTKAITELVPLEINHFEVHDGKLAFVQLAADPNVDLSIEKLELTADNLRNVVAQNRVLPSPIKATGISFGGGKIQLDGALNILKEIPDMDMELSLQQANATALNDFTNYYAGIDFDSGTVELYSELAIADGYLKGYMKPLLIDTKLLGQEDGFLETLWEGFIGFFKFALKNQRTDTLATEIPLSGDLNNIKAGVWPTIGGILKNAWIKAFKGETDDSIEFKDAFKEEATLTGKEKREARRATRKQEREERKAAKAKDSV
ncbi:putative protein DUF748 [Leeuwenhoekiella aestuarii]|uniref:DUF748 domain-containing protein n=1 Tax=Leeuwenhoekiella aestuarii TaxID=2249426 RepID=A0A4Q0NZ77_9FLAO|nr:DUF748 domain-containing protein [Leeuwenhoekiella aestuarii]RXG15948.1 putative protein DUF748 [Leeuwenhoekiella aestuarii]RXG16642.1 putative protein DUF748 [Leeuwenhoekiella aestuarii]